MKRAKSFGAPRILTLIALIFLLLMSLGGWLALSSLTMAPAWAVAALAAGVGALVAIPAMNFFSWLTSLKNFWLNWGIGFLFLTSLFGGSFYTFNTVFANHESEHTEMVTVVRKFTQTRHRSRRVGRRTYTQGAPYKVYFAEVIFPNGITKKLELPYSRYQRLRKGKSMKLTIAKGFFGFQVISLNK